MERLRNEHSLKLERLKLGALTCYVSAAPLPCFPALPFLLSPEG